MRLSPSSVLGKHHELLQGVFSKDLLGFLKNLIAREKGQGRAERFRKAHQAAQMEQKHRFFFRNHTHVPWQFEDSCHGGQGGTDLGT